MGGRHRHRSVSADVAIDRAKSEGALGSGFGEFTEFTIRLPRTDQGMVLYR